MRKLILPSLLTLLVMFVVMFILGYQADIAHSPAGWRGALVISLVSTIIAAVALIIYGLPLHFTLEHLNKAKISYYVFGGFLPGFIIIFLFKPLGHDSLSTLLLQGATFSVIGAITAAVFFYFNRKFTNKQLAK